MRGQTEEARQPEARAGRGEPRWQPGAGGRGMTRQFRPARGEYPIQKITEIYKKVTEMYQKVTELDISCWNVLFRLRSEVAYIGTGPILP